MRALIPKGEAYGTDTKHQEYWRKNLVITAILLAIWFVATFVEGWYARELNSITFLGFPLGFYMSAQGSLIIYVVIIGIYARYMNKLDKEYDVRRRETTNEPAAIRQQRLQLAAQEVLHASTPAASSSSSSCSRSPSRWACRAQWIGYWFLFATIALYAGIGIMSRTVDAAEYYVAGRRVPAFFNGMATGADWMSAASFIGMAGTLYLSGFDGLAFVMGWTGGYCLVALFLAPYLRKFGQFTIPDFLGARYGGNIVRTIGIFAAILCSFTYVVAQIYGVGLITSRFTGLEFGVGVFVGLAGILVCSFLGGMRAVTWTQVAQYIILIIAYLTPVVWLGVKHTGIPIPQFAYGQALQKVTELREEDHRRSEGAGGPQDLAKAAPRTATAALKDPAKASAERQARRSRSSSPTPRRPTRPTTCRSRSEKALDRLSRRIAAKAKAYWTARRKAWRAQRRSAAPARRAVPGQGRAGARHRAAQLPRHRVLHDVRHRGAAAHPDALLHDAERAGRRACRCSGRCSSSSCCTSPRPASRCSRSSTSTRTWWAAVRRAAGMGGGLGEGGSSAAEHHRHQQGRHRAAAPRS